jgi:hypothetical protein
MIHDMKYLTHQWVQKRWTALAGNQNAMDGRKMALRRYQRLMDLIDPGSPRGQLPSALLARAISGRRRSHYPGEVEICLHAVILFVALHARKNERSLRTVRELLVDADSFLGVIIMMTTATEPTAGFLRLFGKRLRRLPEESRARMAREASRRLAFLGKP